MPTAQKTSPRKIAIQERNARVLALRREDHTYQEIQDITGMLRSDACQLVKNHIANLPKAEADELRQWEREKLNRMERDTYDQAFEFRPELDSSGNPISEPVCDEDGNPLRNENGTMVVRFRRDVQSATAGKLLLLKIHERRCKMFGLDAPAKSSTTFENVTEGDQTFTFNVVDASPAHPMLAHLTDTQVHAVLQFVQNNFSDQPKLIEGAAQ